MREGEREREREEERKREREKTMLRERAEQLRRRAARKWVEAISVGSRRQGDGGNASRTTPSICE